VFFNQGERIGEFRKTWKTACKQAGCEGVLFHDLRRSAIRNMRLAGVEESVAMKISGHRTRAVFDRYDIVGPRDIRDAAAKMERRLSESLGTISGTIAFSGPGSSPTDQVKITSKRLNERKEVWLRGVDLNHRPLGYEPNELPDCSTPHLHPNPGAPCRQILA